MAKLLDILKKNFECYTADKYGLDNYQFEPYQDDGEEFEESKIFEIGHSGKNFIKVDILTHTSLFKYFLDGSRLTYKVGDMATKDGRFMPIVAGQLAAGVTYRENKRIRKHDLINKNLILLSNKINKHDLEDIAKELHPTKSRGIMFDLETYERKDEQTKTENFAIAKIQKHMMEMEIQLLTTMVNSGILKPDSMLIIDGSLQFMDKKADQRLFANVVGVSKSFNPNLQGILKKQSQQIATALTSLEFGYRTPVYKYPVKNSDKKIGAWYLRIRPRDRMKNPLEGIVKIEKIVSDKQDEDGFDSGLIDNISFSILLERNVTCHGKDNRWPNHLYPIYLTEKMLKNSFLSSQYFLNLF